MANDNKQQQYGGSGSSENRGENRQEQRSATAYLTDDRMKDIAQQASSQPAI